MWMPVLSAISKLVRVLTGESYTIVSGLKPKASACLTSPIEALLCGILCVTGSLVKPKEHKVIPVHIRRQSPVSALDARRPTGDMPWLRLHDSIRANAPGSGWDGREVDPNQIGQCKASRRGSSLCWVLPWSPASTYWRVLYSVSVFRRNSATYQCESTFFQRPWFSFVSLKNFIFWHSRVLSL